MDVQTLVALLIVGASGTYLLRRWFRGWTGRDAGGCHGGCGGCAHNKSCTGDTPGGTEASP